MDNRSLSHTRWKCQYHIVFIPKYRKRILYSILSMVDFNLHRERIRHQPCMMLFQKKKLLNLKSLCAKP